MPGFQNEPRGYDKAHLRRAALDHVSRYACSSAGLARVLERRLARAAGRGADNKAGPEDVAAVVADMVRLGLVDDESYAESQARTLRRRGASGRALAAGLARKGVPRELIERLAGDEDGEAERRAAFALARRRRLGPFRDPAERAERRQKDLAAMGRAGFPSGLAREVVDAAPEEAPPAPGPAGAADPAQ